MVRTAGPEAEYAVPEGSYSSNTPRSVTDEYIREAWQPGMKNPMLRGPLNGDQFR